jgi:hypothetical protein
MIRLGTANSLTLRNRKMARIDRATHTYVIGQPGTGKSRALETWIMQDILAGRGVGVIDPHGDLFTNLLGRLTNYPEVWDRVVIIDPLDPQWVVSINPLERVPGVPAERTAAFMTDVMIKIWQLDINNAPRMLWLVTNTFLALTLAGQPLGDILLFLGDPTYRLETLARVRNRQVKRYFETEFPQDTGAIRQWIAPVLNKLGALLFDPDVRPMLSGARRLSFRQIMDQKKVLLVNIPKGTLGESTSALLGAFLLARIQSAALSRADVQARSPFYLYMDEFQNYTTDNVQDILAESRKYALSIIFAHQYLEQLNPNLRQAVINTAGTIIAFRIGHQDARKLAPEIFPQGVRPEKPKPQLVIKHRQLWPTLGVEFQSAPPPHPGLQLTALAQREFWVKTRLARQPYKQRSFNMPDVPMTRQLQQQVDQIRAISGHRFGQPKAECQQSAQDRMKENLPFWDR